MELERIKSKIEEISNGDSDFAVRFGEMSIKDLQAFPQTASEALKNRDLRKLTQANHQMKTLIGLFGLSGLDALIQDSLILFEKDETVHKAFVAKVKKEVARYIEMIKDSIQEYH